MSYKDNVEKFVAKGYSMTEAVAIADQLEMEAAPITERNPVVGREVSPAKVSLQGINQKDLVLAAIYAGVESQTAMQVHQVVVKFDPRLSPASVASYLSMLAKEGKVIKCSHGMGYAKPVVVPT